MGKTLSPRRDRFATSHFIPFGSCRCGVQHALCGALRRYGDSPDRAGRVGSRSPYRCGFRVGIYGSRHCVCGCRACARVEAAWHHVDHFAFRNRDRRACGGTGSRGNRCPRARASACSAVWWRPCGGAPCEYPRKSARASLSIARTGRRVRLNRCRG